MALNLLEKTTDLAALAVPLGAVVGATVDYLLERFTVTTFKKGEGLWTTVIGPLHLDDVVGILIFTVLTIAGYKIKNKFMMLFSLGGLATMISTEVAETLRLYSPIPYPT